MIPFFGQGDFQTSANMTPQQIERKRALMAALMPRFGSAKYVGEGLGQLATGVAMGAQGRKLDQRENANRQEGDNLFQRILSGASSRQPQSNTGFSILGQAPMNEGQSVANDTMAALGKQPMGQPSSISESLARTESGGDYSIVNSEGYTGKYQWGQARLDDFNRANGTNITLDQFRQTPQIQEQAQAWHENDILTDLGGYVGREVNGIKMTPGAIVAMAHLGGKGGARKFIESGGAYDPADSNGTNLSDYARTHNSAGQTQQVQQGGDIPLENLYAALAGGMLTPDQQNVVQMMIQQREQAADPMRQMQMQGAQLGLQKTQMEIDQMRNPPAPETLIERQALAAAAGLQPGTPEYQTFILTERLPEAPQPGYRTLTAQEAAERGLPDGAYQIGPDDKISAIGGGGTNVTVNNGGAAVEPLGTEGQILVPDANQPSGYRVEVAPGSKLDQERKAAETAAANAGGIAATTGDTITTAARRALDANTQRVLGGVFGALAAYNPSSPNAEVYRQTDSLKAIASIENINAMRRASPTGAALGAASDRDIELLKQKHGALDPASPNYQRDLMDYTRALMRTVHGNEAGERIFSETFGENQAPGAKVPMDFSTMTIDDLLSVDVNSLSSEEMTAMQRRFDEVPQ